MALANLNTADFIKGSGVTQTDRVIEVSGGGTTIVASDKEIIYSDGADNPVGDAGLTYDKTLKTVLLQSLDFSATPTATDAEGRLLYSSDEGSLVYTLKGGNISTPINGALLALVNNGEATTLNKGEVVYAFGAQGQRVKVKRASNATESTSSKTFGIVAESIASGAEGFVMVHGIVKGIDTSTYTEGDSLYLSTSGGFTKTKPSAPNHLVYVGFVVKVNATSGEVFAKIQNGYEIDELHDVAISGLADGDLLSYENSTSLWKNKTKSALGIGSVTSVAALTIGTTGTDLSSTVANSTTTPVITLNVPTASATNRGVLSSTDWSTFNNKQSTITLTTTGSSGASTFVTNTLNIPTYTLAGLGGFANPMTTLGDIIYGGASGVATRLAGSSGFLKSTGAAAPTWATIAGSDITGAALTKTDDTNVTLTLGGTPTTALLRAASLTLGWTGQLAVGRGGSGASTLTGILVGNGTSAFTAIIGTAGQLLRRNAGDTAYEFFTPTYLTAAITTLNTLTAATQTFAVGTSGTDFAISSATSTHTFNLPTASASNRGALSSTDWSTFNNKQSAITLTTTGSSGASTFITNTLNIPNYTLAGLGGFANPMTTLGDIIYGGASGAATRLAGNTTTAKQFLSQTGTGTISAIPAWATITGADITGAALTKVDDTNVTLTLGGTPATSLLRAASLTLGWTGTLAVSRGGTGAGTLTGVVIGTGTTAMTAVVGTAGQLLRRNAGDTAYEFFTFSGLTNPMTTLGDIIYGGASGVATRLAAGTSGQALVSAGVAAPVWTTLTLENLPGAFVKRSVRVATTGSNITLAGGAPNTLDGVTLAANNRILVKDQTAPAQNGIYIVQTLGSGANGTWVRSTDADTADEIASAMVAVDSGTTLGGFTFDNDFKTTDTLGTTAVTWSRIVDTGYTIPVSQGGTGAVTLTGIVVASGTSAMTAVAGTANQLLRRNAGNTAYEFFTPTYLTAAITSLGGLTAATQVFANDTNVTISSATSTHTLGWTGQLSVARGGTGAATLTGVVIGTGTTAMVAVAGTANQLLRRNAGNTAYEFFTPTYLTANQTITLSGAVTGSGTTAISTTLANSVVGIANLSATGTPSSTTYLRGDNTWATIGGGTGDVTGPAGGVLDNEIALFNGATGKIIKGSGPTIVSGIYTGSGLNVSGNNSILLSSINYTTIRTLSTSNQGVVGTALRLNASGAAFPAIGGGVGLEFETQTSSGGNNEIGSTIESVSTNITSTTEAFDLVFKTMSGGAAATEKMRITSGGNIQVGSYSSPGSIGAGYTAIDVRGSSGGGLVFGTTTTVTGYVFASSTALLLESVGATIFTAGGSERLRILSTGNVGIGTASPSYKLDVAGSIGLSNKEILATDGTSHYVKSNSNLYLEASSIYIKPTFGISLTVSSAGNVGIGITAPLMKLDVTGDINTNTGSYYFNYVQFARTTGTNAYHILNDGSGRAAMYLGGTTDPVNYYDNTTHLFRSAAGSEYARINSSGNVGIGTTTLTYKLNVNGEISSNGTIYVTAATTETRAIEIGTGRTGNGFAYIDLVGDATYTDYGLRILRNNTGANASTEFSHRGTGILAFQTIEASPIVFTTTSTERVRVTESGDVLISTGNLYNYQPAQIAKAAAATLTGSELMAGILNTTGGTYTITLPTGTTIDSADSSSSVVNNSFDWVVINTATGTITIAANGNATLGSLSVPTGTSARFRFRKTAANTYTVYRIS